MSEPTIKQRFSKYVMPVTESGCWLWTGRVDEKGRARFDLNRKSRYASRVSWHLYRGEIPAGVLVLHHCDVPSCVNPDHLYLGTHSDNLRDAHARHRRPPVCGIIHGEGERNAFSKLTEAQAREALAHPEISSAEYGRRWNVGRNLVGRIRQGVRWQWLTK